MSRLLCGLDDGGGERKLEINGSLLLLYGDLRTMEHLAVHASQQKDFGAVKKAYMNGMLRMGPYV